MQRKPHAGFLGDGSAAMRCCYPTTHRGSGHDGDNVGDGLQAGRAGSVTVAQTTGTSIDRKGF